MNISNALKNFLRIDYVGFLTDFKKINGSVIREMYNLIACPSASDYKLYDEYHDAFARRIGPGSCLSYASARMGFYELLMTLDLTSKDEVLLLGFTCSVMPNAVVRAGAKPVFYDLDLYTFGSSLENIKRCVTDRTRVIVCQHSFGIPCDILDIQIFCRENGILLVEDCSIAFGSKIDGCSVGNFGDAAIFSTDHTKPVNTLIGGVVFSNRDDILSALRIRWEKLDQLNENFQLRILGQVREEQGFLCNKYYFYWLIWQRLKVTFGRMLMLDGPFLTSDYSSTPTSSSYPYPARLPLFLTLLGLRELSAWDKTFAARRNLLAIFTATADQFGLPVPKVYRDPRRLVVPLRIVGLSNNINTVKKNLKSILHVNSFWFMSPISSAVDPLEHYGFKVDNCRVALFASEHIYNIPTNISAKKLRSIVSRLSVTI